MPFLDRTVLCNAQSPTHLVYSSQPKRRKEVHQVSCLSQCCQTSPYFRKTHSQAVTTDSKATGFVSKRRDWCNCSVLELHQAFKEITIPGAIFQQDSLRS